jgi:hypothetical protein
MFEIEKHSPIDVPDRGRVSNRLLVASMLLAAAISYALVVLQPGLVKAIDAPWARSVLSPATGNPSWAVPAIASCIAIGAASLAMLLLSAFVSGVQRAPYLWLSPVLVGFSTLVLSRLHVDLPFIGVQVPLLSSLAGLVLIGGGALVQIGGLACAASGSLLLLLPASTLVAGYTVRFGTLEHAWAALNTASALYLFVLIVTSLGVAIVAWVARPGSANGWQNAARMRQQFEQLAMTRERAQLLELHLGEAQRRAEHAEYQLRTGGFAGGREDTGAFVALARPSMTRFMPHFGVAILFTAIPLAVYFGVYRPLNRRLVTQQALAAEAARDHADTIEALRRHYDAERTNTLALLNAARTRTGAATPADLTAAAPTPAAAMPAAAAAAPAEPEAAAVEHKVPVKARVRAVSSKRPKKISAARAAGKRATKPAAAVAAPQPNAAEREADQALKEGVNDDPIGGLDGM